jgi:hypothetical protein
MIDVPDKVCSIMSMRSLFSGPNLWPSNISSFLLCIASQNNLTPLSQAASRGYRSTVLLLLKHSADVNLADMVWIHFLSSLFLFLCAELCISVLFCRVFSWCDRLIGKLRPNRKRYLTEFYRKETIFVGFCFNSLWILHRIGHFLLPQMFDFRTLTIYRYWEWTRASMVQNSCFDFSGEVDELNCDKIQLLLRGSLMLKERLWSFTLFVSNQLQIRHGQLITLRTLHAVQAVPLVPWNFSALSFDISLCVNPNGNIFVRLVVQDM